MATQKPISTISYNSEEFLKEKLNQWVNAHIIQCYQYIAHKGEDGDKDHIHLRIEPNKKLDPMELSEELKEYKLGEKLPRGVRPWRPSKEEDWFLYAVHDKAFLSLKYNDGDKGEKLPYQDNQIVVSDGYDLEVAMVRARSSLNHSSVNMATRLQQGENALNLILQGENPYMVNSILKALQITDYNRLAQDLSYANKQLNSLINQLSDIGIGVVSDGEGNLIIEKSEN